MKGSDLFQEITLISLSWALSQVSIHAFCGAARQSQIRIDLSTEQDAKTLRSLGLHCKSSTEALLAGNNVVLIEAPGYESEIFVPQAHKGRIAFVNVIPNRRCCFNWKGMNSNENTYGAQSAHVVNAFAKKILNLESNARTSGGNDKYFPFGKSPLRERQCPVATSIKKQKLSYLQTPQRLRKSAALNNYDRSYSALSRNCRFSAASTTLSPFPSSLADSAGGDAGIWSPNNINLKNKCAPTLIGKGGSLQTNTPTKWRKCLTPVRTYGRSNVTLCRKRSPAKMQGRTKVEPTQGKKATCNIDLRKHEAKDVKNLTPDVYLSKEAHTAFDLLTGPARDRSTKLKQQFRNACVNKTEGTQSRYKKLSIVPPLESQWGVHNFQTKLKNT
uniref:Uncharacterized protein n=1 Tax=Glossina brevipalpis TaxID=37001 RepID=A0A1A9WWL2_9MUSC